MVTLRARLARGKGTFARKNQTRNQAGRRASRQPFGKRRWKYPECKNGITGIRNQSSRQQVRRRSERTTSRNCGKKISLDIGKRIARSFVTTWKMWNRTSLRSPPPLERKIKEWTLEEYASTKKEENLLAPLA
jgi:hypothetical protein